MGNSVATVIEDRSYKPSSPEYPERRFLIETEEFRWEVHVSRYEIAETGTPVFRAVTPEGHSAYGLTVNEAVNDIAGIMRLKLSGKKTRKVAFDDVKHWLDPPASAREEIKVSEAYSRKRLLFRLLRYLSFRPVIKREVGR